MSASELRKFMTRLDEADVQTPGATTQSTTTVPMQQGAAPITTTSAPPQTNPVTPITKQINSLVTQYQQSRPDVAQALEAVVTSLVKIQTMLNSPAAPTVQ